MYNTHASSAYPPFSVAHGLKCFCDGHDSCSENNTCEVEDDDFFQVGCDVSVKVLTNVTSSIESVKHICHSDRLQPCLEIPYSREPYTISKMPDHIICSIIAFYPLTCSSVLCVLRSR